MINIIYTFGLLTMLVVVSSVPELLTRFSSSNPIGTGDVLLESNTFSGVVTLLMNLFGDCKTNNRVLECAVLVFWDKNHKCKTFQVYLMLLIL